MMETFIVLGLCFILYEALDFFQGCMHSSTPSTTDQIDAYRRQLDEQRQQQQQEQFLANLSPLLGAQLATLSSSSTINTVSSTTTATPTASTASVISDLHRQQEEQQQLQLTQTKVDNHSVSTPALNAGFRPAHCSIYESQTLQSTSSLPRDYYYVQQQQLKNKHSAKSLLSKFSSTSDNRIFPETASSVLGAPAGVITTQPGLVGNAAIFDYTSSVAAQPTSLAFDLKRAILSNNCNNSSSSSSANNTVQDKCKSNISSDRNSESVQPKHTQRRLVGISTLLEEQNNTRNLQHCSKNSINSIDSGDEADGDVDADDDNDNDNDEAGSSSSDSSISSDSASAGSALLASCGYSSEQDAADEREFAAGSCSSSHADFREIECERLRRKCVSVKRIYSISEKF